MSAMMPVAAEASQSEESEALALARHEAVAATLARVRELVPDEPAPRAALEAVLAELESLATRAELWRAPTYSPLQAGELQARYLVSEDADRRYALYLNQMAPGKRTPPHDHTTWACIAAVEGVEHNYLYERLDDGTEPGRAALRETGVVRVEPGTGIALGGDDIHAVRIEQATPVRHLHLYGRALETLDTRTAFDLKAGTCRTMPIGVQTRR